jgi:hypothetical protein
MGLLRSFASFDDLARAVGAFAAAPVERNASRVAELVAKSDDLRAVMVDELEAAVARARGGAA